MRKYILTLTLFACALLLASCIDTKKDKDCTALEEVLRSAINDGCIDKHLFNVDVVMTPLPQPDTATVEDTAKVKEKPWFIGKTHALLPSGDLIFQGNNYEVFFAKHARDSGHVKVTKASSGVAHFYPVDLDGEGKHDVFYLDNKGFLHFLRNRGDTFEETTQLYDLNQSFVSVPSVITVADINNDHNIDVVYSRPIKIDTTVSNIIFVRHGNRYGQLDDPKPLHFLGAAEPQMLLVRDIDCDTDADIVFKLVSDDSLLYALENSLIFKQSTGEYDLNFTETFTYMVRGATTDFDASWLFWDMLGSSGLLKSDLLFDSDFDNDFDDF